MLTFAHSEPFFRFVFNIYPLLLQLFVPVKTNEKAKETQRNNRVQRKSTFFTHSLPIHY